MTNFFSLLRKSISGLDRFPAFLLALWVAVMLSLPLLRLIFSIHWVVQGLILAVLLQAVFVLHVLYKSWGWWSMLRMAIAMFLLVWAIYAIVIRSGLPYGNLQYTQALQPQVLGVPVVIPLTWLMMLPPAWAVARLITRGLSGCLMRFSFVLISAIAFTAWGFYFDPLMVHLGVSSWAPAGGYYGVPWLNFVGWLFISGLITFAISPTRVPGGLLVLVYALAWLVEFILLFLLGGMMWAALIGFALMGALLLSAAIISR